MAIESEAARKNDDLIDLRDVIGVFRRRTWSFLTTVALIFVAVVLYTSQATPIYSATASVVLDVSENNVLDLEAVVSGLPPDSAMVDTQVEVLRSRSLAGEVVDTLGLTALPEFNPSLREPGMLTRLRRSFLGGSSSGDGANDTARDTAIDILLNSVRVSRSGVTYVIAITARSANAARAQAIANTYAEEYLERQVTEKFDETDRVNAWLNDRVASLREDVEAKEQAVAEYRDEAGLLDAEGATLVEQQITDVNAQLAAERAALADARARLSNVRSRLEAGVSAEAIAEVLNSAVIRELRAQQAAIARREAELDSRYGPRHPEILTVQREREDLDRQIEREIDRIVVSLENEVNVASQRVGSLENSLESLRQDLGASNSALVRLRALEREAEASRALLESFLQRFRQTDEAEGITSPDARIVTTAPLPLQPSEPNVRQNLVLGALVGLIGGMMVMFALETFDNGLHSGEEVESRVGVPHIASVPILRPGMLRRVSNSDRTPPQFLLDHPFSTFSETFRTIRSALRLAAIGRESTVVASTSAIPGEGKTTLTTCLGRVSAMAGSKTIVVDCDLRRSMLSKGVAKESGVGLIEVVSGECALEDAIQRDGQTDLDILPLASATFTPKDLFGTKAFAELLEELRGRYDLVILDTAPALGIADTREVARQADAVIVSAVWRKSAVGALVRVVELLRGAGANVTGVVLNQVDFKAQGRHGYDAGYAYFDPYTGYSDEARR